MNIRVPHEWFQKIDTQGPIHVHSRVIKNLNEFFDCTEQQKSAHLKLERVSTSGFGGIFLCQQVLVFFRPLIKNTDPIMRKIRIAGEKPDFWMPIEHEFLNSVNSSV